MNKPKALTNPNNDSKDKPNVSSKLKKFWKADDPGLFCIICENTICNAMKTDCGYHFCSYCIGLWQKNCPQCPICKENIHPLNPNPEMDRDIAQLIAGMSAKAQAERDSFVKARESKEQSFLDRCADEPDDNKVNGIGGNADGGLTNSSSYGIPGHTPNLQPNKKNVTILQNNSPSEKRLTQALNETKTLERELQAIYTKIINTGTALNAREDQLILKLCSGKTDEHSFDILPSIGNRSNDLSAKGARALTASRSAKIVGRPRSAMIGRPISRGSVSGSHHSTGDTPSIPQLSSGKDLTDQLELDDLIELTNDAMELEKFLQTESFEKLTTDDVDYLFEEGAGDGDGNVRRAGELELVRAKPQLAPEFKLHPEVEEIVKKCSTKIIPVAPGSSKIKRINFVKDEEQSHRPGSAKQNIRPKTALPGRATLKHFKPTTTLPRIEDCSGHSGGDGDSLPAKALLTPIAKAANKLQLPDMNHNHTPIIRRGGSKQILPIKSRPGTRQ